MSFQLTFWLVSINQALGLLFFPVVLFLLSFSIFFTNAYINKTTLGNAEAEAIMFSTTFLSIACFFFFMLPLYSIVILVIILGTMLTLLQILKWNKDDSWPEWVKPKPKINKEPDKPRKNLKTEI